MLLGFESVSEWVRFLYAFSALSRISWKLEDVEVGQV